MTDIIAIITSGLLYGSIYGLVAIGMTLVILGLMTVYQLTVVQTGTGIPDFVLWLSSETTLEFLPNNLLVFVPRAVQAQP